MAALGHRGVILWTLRNLVGGTLTETNAIYELIMTYYEICGTHGFYYTKCHVQYFSYNNIGS